MLGILLALLSAIFFGVAVAIQKYAFQDLKKFSLSGMATNGRWILSMVIGLSGLVIYVIALSIDDLSTVQPVASIYLLIPIFTGAFIFKEHIGGKKWSLIGLFLIGMLLVSLS